MILLLIALLSATSAVQGGVINLTLTEPAHVVLDNCMYFNNTLTSSANLSAGEYAIKITHYCYGTHYIEVRGKGGVERIQVRVEKDPDLGKSVMVLENQTLNLRKRILQLESRNDYLQSLVETLNSINVELYDKLREYTQENKDLRAQVNKLSLMAKNCSEVVDRLENMLTGKNETIDTMEKENLQLRSQLESLNQSLATANTYSEIFRTMFFTTLAFLIGAMFAVLRR